MRKQALVIIGPQGSGKSLFARWIARQIGDTTVEVGCGDLGSYFGMSIILDSEPDTLIIDGLPTDEKTTDTVKAMIASETTRVDCKGKDQKLVKTPNIVFCTGDKNPLPFRVDERRFLVVRIEGIDNPEHWFDATR